MIHNLFIRTICTALLLASAGCRQLDEEGLQTEVTIRLVMPDSRPVTCLEIRDETSGFYNINTYERTTFPTPDANTATVRLRRGVYTFTVEAEATYDDGSTCLLRCADYNQITQAITWVREQESIVLLLKSVN